MEAWVVLRHHTEEDLMQAEGRLMGGYYSDVETICRVLKDQVMYEDEIVDIVYTNNGKKAGLYSRKGIIYGAYLDRMPMREDVPTKG